jgi:hypothetical protein
LCPPAWIKQRRGNKEKARPKNVFFVSHKNIFNLFVNVARKKRRASPLY